jgi:hypothetical protein
MPVRASLASESPLTPDLPPTPAGGGVLPYWLVITSVASVYNVVQNYVTLKQSREIYSKKPEQSEWYEEADRRIG